MSQHARSCWFKTKKWGWSWKQNVDDICLGIKIFSSEILIAHIQQILITLTIFSLVLYIWLFSVISIWKLMCGVEHIVKGQYNASGIMILTSHFAEYWQCVSRTDLPFVAAMSRLLRINLLDKHSPVMEVKHLWKCGTFTNIQNWQLKSAAYTNLRLLQSINWSLKGNSKLTNFIGITSYWNSQ